MNRQPTREEFQKFYQRWHQLKTQHGENAASIPEYQQLTKVIRYLQAQFMQKQQQGQQNQQNQQNQQSHASGGVPPPPQNLLQPQNLPQHAVQQQYPVNVEGFNRNPQGAANANTLAQMQPNMGLPQGLPGLQQLGTPIQNAQMAPNQPQQLLYQQQQNPSSASVSAGGGTPANSGFPRAGTPGFATETPFLALQLQLLKAQSQSVKYLFKPNGTPGQIPQQVIEFAVNDRLAFSDFSAPSSVPTPAPPAGPIPPQQLSQSPAPFQQQMPPQPPMPGANLAQLETASSADSNGRVPMPKQASIPPSSAQKPSEPPKTVPVPLEPRVPVELHELVPDKGANSKTIVPITRPNIQVDTFEVPDFASELAKDVAFSSLYTPQSRFQYPSLMPDGINIEEIVNNREALILLQIDQEIVALTAQLEKLPEEDSLRQPLEMRLNQLSLLPFQKQLRGKILSQVWFSKLLLPNSHPNFLAKFNNLSLDSVTTTQELYQQQLYTLVQAQNRKHQNVLNKILSHRNAGHDKFVGAKEKLDRLANRINSVHTQTAREEQKKLERMAKQRLQALKSNDEEAYLKLLDHTKDTRITHLLKQTNQFLDTLAQAVETQQRESKSIYGKKVEDEALADERREKIDYYEVAHRIKEEVTKQPSILVGGTLKEYQLKGLQWMVSLFNNHLNGILADEMGLGKTIQSLSLLTYLIEVKKIQGPYLVIVPLSTLTNWNLEFEKWAPSVKKITYKGTPVQRKVLQQDIRLGNFQILLTTYEYIIKDKALLAKIKWVHMIIDEGHRMKNALSKLSETLTHNYHSDYRLILTGTPLQNNLPELWALLNFALPKIFNSVKSFDEWFNTPFANTGGQDKIELSEEETLLVIRRLHKVLRPFLLRRLKKDVEKDLPNKVEKVVKCKMSALQSKLYQQMLKHNILFVGDPDDHTKPMAIKNVNNQIMQLKKICNHPFVYEEVENLINPMVETNDQIWRVAGKFELLDKVLPKFKATGHRVLIFFQMTQIMDIMEDFLRLRGLKYMRLDGGTKADDRTTLLKLFNAPDSEYFCFLLSTRAGGLGLNLQTADTVIIFDTDWNPHQDLQAQDRAHRIGQKNEVRILRLITEDSVEEMILDRAHAKLEIDGKVIQAGKFDNKSTAEEQEALLRALLEKEEERKQKGTSEDDDDLDDDELNQVIARSDEEIDIFRKLDDQRMASTRAADYSTRLFSEGELPEIYKMNYEDLYKLDEAILQEYGRGTRERKTATYDDNLTEEQWLRKIDGMVLDGSDDEYDFRPKKGKLRSRGRSKQLEDENGAFDSDNASKSGSVASTKRRALLDDSDDEPVSKKQRLATPKAKPRPKSRPKSKGKASNRPTLPLDPLSVEERTKLQFRVGMIYELLMNHTNEHGRRLIDIFMVKPLKKLYPDYYVLIKNPLAMDAVKKRYSTKNYSTIREVLEDVHLIFSNARIYNEEGSIVYQDATELELLALAKYREMAEADEDADSVVDFRAFDEAYNLKPLVIPSAVKQPVEDKLNRLDHGEDIDSPVVLLGAVSTAGVTEDLTPFDFE